MIEEKLHAKAIVNTSEEMFWQLFCLWRGQMNRAWLLWGNGLVIKAMSSQARDHLFETTGWLLGWLNFSSFWGQSKEC